MRACLFPLAKLGGNSGKNRKRGSGCMPYVGVCCKLLPISCVCGSILLWPSLRGVKWRDVHRLAVSPSTVPLSTRAMDKGHNENSSLQDTIDKLLTRIDIKKFPPLPSYMTAALRAPLPKICSLVWSSREFKIPFLSPEQVTKFLAYLKENHGTWDNFLNDLESGKLGRSEDSLADEQDVWQALSRYDALQDVCKGLPPVWAESPGSMLVSFSVTIDDIPANWAPNDPVKGFFSLRGSKGATRANLPHKEAKSRALELARNFWAEDKSPTKEELADQIILVLRREGHGERSVGMIMKCDLSPAR